MNIATSIGAITSYRLEIGLRRIQSVNYFKFNEAEDSTLSFRFLSAYQDNNPISPAYSGATCYHRMFVLSHASLPSKGYL